MAGNGRRRLPDDETKYYEDTIANTIEGENAVKRAIYEVENPNVLLELIRVLAALFKIRKRTMERRESRKDEEGKK